MINPRIECAHTRIVSVAELQVHPANRNKHPEKQIKALAKIISKNGQRSPIVVSNLSGYITKGHGRLEAIKLLGWESCAVDYQDYKDEAEEFRDRIADNEIARYGEFDKNGFIEDIQALGNVDLDFEEFGLIDFELPKIEVLDPQCDEDETPEVTKDAKTVRGDIYELGNHRVMCGDSTMIDDVDRLMNGEKADMVFTSPPYNGNTTSRSINLYLDNDLDNKSDEDYISFNKNILVNISCVTSDNAIICYNINYNKKSPSLFIDVIFEGKKLFPLKETIIWEKQMAVTLNGDNLTRIFEFIFIFAKNEFKINKGLHECEKNLWKVSNIGANLENHKACFPIGLVEKAINLFAKECCLLFEPFTGSGSTLIACEKTNRKCYGMELDEHYCDVIVSRWCKYTGKNKIKLNGQEIEWETN